MTIVFNLIFKRAYPGIQVAEVSFEIRKYDQNFHSWRYCNYLTQFIIYILSYYLNTIYILSFVFECHNKLYYWIENKSNKSNLCNPTWSISMFRYILGYKLKNGLEKKFYTDRFFFLQATLFPYFKMVFKWVPVYSIIY